MSDATSTSAGAGALASGPPPSLARLSTSLLGKAHHLTLGDADISRAALAAAKDIFEYGAFAFASFPMPQT
jgi:hypothetical protein